MKHKQWPVTPRGDFAEHPLDFGTDWSSAVAYSRGLPDFGYPAEPVFLRHPQSKYDVGVEPSRNAGTFLGNWYRDCDLTALWQLVVLNYHELNIWPIIVPGELKAETDDVFTERLSSETPNPVEVFRQLAATVGSTFKGLAAHAAQRRPFTYRPPVIKPDQTLMTFSAFSPADIPYETGWSGAQRYGLTGCMVSAVVQSWQDRFGAVLVGLGRDYLVLHVPHLTVSKEDRNLLRIEHQLFCPSEEDRLGKGSRFWFFRW